MTTLVNSDRSNTIFYHDGESSPQASYSEGKHSSLYQRMLFSVQYLILAQERFLQYQSNPSKTLPPGIVSTEIRECFTELLMNDLQSEHKAKVLSVEILHTHLSKYSGYYLSLEQLKEYLNFIWPDLDTFFHENPKKVISNILQYCDKKHPPMSVVVPRLFENLVRQKAYEKVNNEKLDLDGFYEAITHHPESVYSKVDLIPLFHNVNKESDLSNERFLRSPHTIGREEIEEKISNVIDGILSLNTPSPIYQQLQPPSPPRISNKRLPSDEDLSNTGFVFPPSDEESDSESEDMSIPPNQSTESFWVKGNQTSPLKTSPPPTPSSMQSYRSSPDSVFSFNIKKSSTFTAFGTMFSKYIEDNYLSAMSTCGENNTAVPDDGLTSHNNSCISTDFINRFSVDTKLLLKKIFKELETSILLSFESMVEIIPDRARKTIQDNHEIFFTSMMKEILGFFDNQRKKLHQLLKDEGMNKKNIALETIDKISEDDLIDLFYYLQQQQAEIMRLIVEEETQHPLITQHMHLHDLLVNNLYSLSQEIIYSFRTFLSLPRLPSWKTPDNVIDNFTSTKTPSISLEDYIIRFLSYWPTQDIFTMHSKKVASSVHLNTYLRHLATVMIYMDRFIENTSCEFTNLNIHRVFAVSYLITAKLYEDTYYNNKLFSSVAGIPLADANELEESFLKALEFNLNISSEEYFEKLEDLRLWFTDELFSNKLS